MAGDGWNMGEYGETSFPTYHIPPTAYLPLTTVYPRNK